MNFFSYLRVELNRIFHSKTNQVIMLLTIISPVVGYKVNRNMVYYINPNMHGHTLSCKVIVNPCLIRALIGGLLFTLLTLLKFDRVKKYKTKALTNSIALPLSLNIVKVIALLVAAIVSAIITSVVYLPYTIIKMGALFDPYTYLNCFFIFIMM